MRRLRLCSLSLILTLTLMTVLTTGMVNALEGSGELWVLVSGDVRALYTVKTKASPIDVEIPVVRGAVYVSVYCDGEPIPFEYDEVSGALRFTMTCETARIEAVSSELTSKSGMLWTLKVNPHDLPIDILLPPEALVVSVRPTDFRATFRDSRIVLSFPAGAGIEVEFLLVPQLQAQEKPPLLLIASGLAAIAVSALAALAAYKIKFRDKRKG